MMISNGIVRAVPSSRVTSTVCKKRISELEQAAAYMQQAQAGANAGNAGASDATPGSNPDDVVDADFSDKNKA